MNRTVLLDTSQQINHLANNLFRKLDNKLKVRSFIIKLKSDVDNVRLSIEPRDRNDDYLKSVMSNIRGKLKENEKTPGIGELQAVLMQEIDRVDSNNLVTYVCQPVIFRKFLYFIVIQFNSTRLKKHYSLEIDRVDDNYRLFTSIIDAAIEKFFRDTSIFLSNSLSRSESLVVDDENEDEIIRWAGEALTQSIIYNSIDRSVFKQRGREFKQLKKFYEDCNIISSMMYEGNTPNGKILIAPPTHENINERFLLKTKIALNDHRTIRKLLEILTKNTYLLYHAGFVYGIGSVNVEHESFDELFTVNFMKHSTWSLSHGSNLLMTVEYGMPKLICRRIDDDEIYKNVEDTFPKLEQHEIERLLVIINRATMQKNGTILVISSTAEKEAERLRDQSILFEPFRLSPDRVINASNIDGAILIDPMCTCYSIGTILDGMATDKGKNSRGARFNSAVRYIEQRKRPSMAIVVSEDGMIDVITNSS